MAFIVNTESRPHTIGLTSSGGRAQAGLLLKPGLNSIPDEKWEEALKNPMIQKMVQAGVFKQRSVDKDAELGAGDVPTTGGSAQRASGEQRDQTGSDTDEESDALTGLKVEDAQDLIKDTLDTKLLERWKLEESKGAKRKGILTAIDHQLEELTSEADEA